MASHHPAPLILERVAGITSIRDADLLDISMVRTLFELLAPQRIGLFRLEAGQCREAALWAVAPNCEVLFGEVPEALLLRARMANGGRLRWQEQAGGRTVHAALFPVAELRAASAYLYVEHEEGRVLDDTRLIDAFLRFHTNYCSLLDYSQRDQLTGLLNRRTFNDCVLRLLAPRPAAAGGEEAAERMPEPGTRRPPPAGNWLALLDLDHFKRVNDRFGHLYGDEVLLTTSQILKRSFRQSDLLFRFGGEEFVVILRDTDREGALAALEHFRAAMAAHVFPQLGQITVSIGVVELKGRADVVDLVDRADRALYFAKGNGRNQVAVYEDLVGRGLVRETQPRAGEVELF